MKNKYRGAGREIIYLRNMSDKYIKNWTRIVSQNRLKPIIFIEKPI